MNNKQPAYKRGRYKPRKDRGNLKEGSLRWLARELGLSLMQVRLKRKKGEL